MQRGSGDTNEAISKRLEVIEEEDSEAFEELAESGSRVLSQLLDQDYDPGLIVEFKEDKQPTEDPRIDLIVKDIDE